MTRQAVSRAGHVQVYCVGRGLTPQHMQHEAEDIRNMVSSSISYTKRLPAKTASQPAVNFFSKVWKKLAEPLSLAYVLNQVGLIDLIGLMPTTGPPCLGDLFPLSPSPKDHIHLERGGEEAPQDGVGG